MVERGSRKHVLDWTAKPDFPQDLLQLLQPIDCELTSESRWQPMGRAHPAEARLSRFGPTTIPHADWSGFAQWWLEHGGSTPTWDIAMQCDVEGRPGLVLVEAKANVPELTKGGKSLNKLEAGRPRSEASVARSIENHERIGAAIFEARNALAAQIPEIAIDRDQHFQLSNRIAFAWKLASMGIPTVLLYLGFTGDEGIRDAGEPFADDVHWQRVFRSYLSGVCPPSALERSVEVNGSKMWILARSRRRLQDSPPRGVSQKKISHGG